MSNKLADDKTQPINDTQSVNNYVNIENQPTWVIESLADDKRLRDIKCQSSFDVLETEDSIDTAHDVPYTYRTPTELSERRIRLYTDFSDAYRLRRNEMPWEAAAFTPTHEELSTNADSPPSSPLTKANLNLTTKTNVNEEQLNELRSKIKDIGWGPDTQEQRLELLKTFHSEVNETKANCKICYHILHPSKDRFRDGICWRCAALEFCSRCDNQMTFMLPNMTLTKMIRQYIAKSGSTPSQLYCSRCSHYCALCNSTILMFDEESIKSYVQPRCSNCKSINFWEIDDIEKISVDLTNVDSMPL